MMNASPEWLSEKTRQFFDLTNEQKIVLQGILEGGSDRSYFRVRWPNTEGVILMHYNPEKTENLFFAEIGQFLKQMGLSVPEIYHHDAEEHLIWMEDLGEKDLFEIRKETWETLKPLYEDALANIFLLHQRGLQELKNSSVRMMDHIGPDLYRWEHEYFLEYFVEKICSIPKGDFLNEKFFGELNSLTQRLSELPPVLMHRDYQSKNVMIRNHKSYAIDFQGLRIGTCFYDVASLLFDPYIRLEEGRRNHLLSYYYGLGEKEFSQEEFERNFYDAAVQRLLQALGAYGFLGTVKNKKLYLNFIAPGLENLKKASSLAGAFPQLLKLIAECERRLAPIGLLEAT